MKNKTLNEKDILIVQEVIHPNLKQLIELGIPVINVNFQSAVNNSDNIPETNFNAASNNASRRVKMWYSPDGLVCFQKDKYFIVPLANVIFAKFE